MPWEAHMPSTIAYLFCERAPFAKPESGEICVGREVEMQPSVSPEPRFRSKTAYVSIHAVAAFLSSVISVNLAAPVCLCFLTCKTHKVVWVKWLTIEQL